MAENPNPTRMELLKAKTRVKLAKNGHKLLKQKRDALVMEFFKILSKAQDLRSELNAQMKIAYTALAVAQAYHGMQEIESAALAVKRAPGVRVEVRNIMGVKYRHLKARRRKSSFLRAATRWLARARK